MQKAMNFNDVANGSDYVIHFWCISQGDAINVMKNHNLD